MLLVLLTQSLQWTVVCHQFYCPGKLYETTPLRFPFLMEGLYLDSDHIIMIRLLHYFVAQPGMPYTANATCHFNCSLYIHSG